MKEKTDRKKLFSSKYTSVRQCNLIIFTGMKLYTFECDYGNNSQALLVLGVCTK